jgi:hypothetical protein
VSCYRLIDAEKAHHGVSRLARVLGVARAGYYFAFRLCCTLQKTLQCRLMLALRALLPELFRVLFAFARDGLHQMLYGAELSIEPIE